MPMKELVEKRNELEAKQDALAKVFEEAGPDVDFSKVKCIQGETTTAKCEKVGQMNKELDDLQDEVTKLALAEQASKTVTRFKDAKTGQEQIIHPDGGDGADAKPITKSIGQLFMESDGDRR